MRSSYLKVMFVLTMSLICAMFIKVIIFTLATPIKSEPFSYEEVVVEENETSYVKPTFKDTTLNDYINNYLTENSCVTLEYNVFDLKNNIVNIFLNCGTPKSVLYDYENSIELSIDDLILDNDAFIETTKKLLKLKYPVFHVDDIDFSKSVYDFRENEIIGYYTSKEYGSTVYHINNNELKGLLNYEMTYDEEYENEVFTLDPNKKSIAFTYDDGPSTYDLELIDLLTESHSKATFFVVGNRLNNYTSTVEKLVSSGMEIGNHTYSHKVLTKLSSTSVKEEITKTSNLFYEKTGYTMKLFRASYGSVNKNVLVNTGMPSILWSIDTLDWKNRDKEKVYNAIMNNAKDGEIVLMHSLYKSTVEATKMAIKSLYKEGYQIVSVGELADLKGKTLNVGSSYTSLK